MKVMVVKRARCEGTVEDGSQEMSMGRCCRGWLSREEDVKVM